MTVTLQDRLAFAKEAQRVSEETGALDVAQRERLASVVARLERVASEGGPYPLTIADEAFLQGVWAQVGLRGDALAEGQREALAKMTDGPLQSLGLPSLAQAVGNAEKVIEFLRALDERCDVFDATQRERLDEMNPHNLTEADALYLRGLAVQGVGIVGLTAGRQ